MAFADLWALEMLLAAFAGGAFGAAIGALPAFTFTGFLVIIGETYGIVQRNLAGGTALGNVAITDSIAFGVVFGPHVSFAGGAAAAAYAAKRGYLDADFEYHVAKNITVGLGTRPDVLAVGGVFGVLGYWVATLSATLSAPWDPVALGVVLSALAHRAVLGYDLIGSANDGLLNMKPFERGTERLAADGGAAGQSTVEPWLPYQYRWSHVTMLGLVVGVLGAYIAYLTGSAFLGFGISAASLLYINAGVDRIPVTHHIMLPASTAVIAFSGLSTGQLTPDAIAGAVPLSQALALGAVFGLVGALAGELLQRVFYAHAETHLDPPAASIVVTSLLIAVLAMAGVFPGSAWVPLP